MNLTLHYPDVIGPALVTFTPGNPEFQSRLTNDYTLADGQQSQDLAVEAAQQFAADILQVFGVVVETSTDPADYPPTPALTPEEQRIADDKELGFRRGIAWEKMRADLFAENRDRLRKGEFTIQDLDDCMEAEITQRALRKLRDLSFELVIPILPDLPEPVFNAAFKARWDARIKAEF